MTTWSEAFAQQASSDLDAYEFLAGTALPVSHRLHYLQMWLEKLCKAYLWTPASSANVQLLRERHGVIAKILPRLISEHWNRIGFDRRPDIGQIRALCREIDLLQPQIKDGDRRPDNFEYPWPMSSGAIQVPARWQFPVASSLHSNPGKLLLKAGVQLTRRPSIYTA